MDQNKIDKLKLHKDADVRALVLEYERILSAEAYDTLLIVRKQRKSWNDQIKDKKVDIFDPGQKATVNTILKIFNNIQDLMKLEQSLLDKLTPREIAMEKEQATSDIDTIRQKVKNGL